MKWPCGREVAKHQYVCGVGADPNDIAQVGMIDEIITDSLYPNHVSVWWLGDWCDLHPIGTLVLVRDEHGALVSEGGAHG